MTDGHVEVPVEVWRELLAAATDAAEEVYITSNFTRRSGVRERWERLTAALDAARRIEAE